MIHVKTIYSLGPALSDRLRVLSQLIKLRLSMLVALSAVFGYAMAAGSNLVWANLFWIGLGGLMVTGASNVLNQIFEQEQDAKMDRTAKRPLPQKEITQSGALIYSMLLAIFGIGVLGYVFNLPAALFGMIGLLLYAFVYTPMKKISPFCVFVGAIPGGMPPLIGWVAFSGQLETGALILFAFQFFWQFPHFWAIAWLLDEDYKKAGYFMLPTGSGKSKASAKLMLVYTLCLIPLIWFPFQAGLIGWGGVVALVLLGLAFALPSFSLYRKLDDKSAKKLMLASFVYLPLSQIAFLLG